GDLTGFFLDASQLVVSAEVRQDLVRPLEEPARRVEVAAAPQRRGGDALQGAFLEARVGVLRRPGRLDGAVERGVDPIGREVELAQASSGLQLILTGAERLEQSQAALVAAPRPRIVALAGQDLPAVAQDARDAVGATQAFPENA